MDNGPGVPFRERLDALLHRLDHVLPAQAPIRDFVHHNTLHGFAHLPFAQALRAARQLTGASVYLPAAEFRRLFAGGRIDDEDIDAAVADSGGDLDAPLAGHGEPTLTRRRVRRAALLHDLAPLAPATLATRLAAADADPELWAACLDSTPAPAAAAADPFAANWDDAGAWNARLARIGCDQTLRELLLALTGEDALARLRPLLIRLLADHLDLGLAHRHSPQRAAGLYAGFLALARHDAGWTLDQMPDGRREILALPEDPLETIEQELSWLGLAEPLWPGYLERLALELPGWSGMVLWRHRHPDHPAAGGRRVSMVDYLAIRLVLERLTTQDIIRRHWNTPVAVPVLDKVGERLAGCPGELRARLAARCAETPEALAGRLGRQMDRCAAGDNEPERWAELAAAITAVAADVRAGRRAGAAWPLYALCRAVGWSAANLRAAGDGVGRLHAELATFDADAAGQVWLEAYERHYREQVFTALAANHGRCAEPAAPSAQVVFCMDDREEGIRRHLEEIAPAVETLGAAAHFGVFQNWRGIDDETVTPLCPVVPVVVRPAHEVREVARDPAALAPHVRRRHWRLGGLRLLHDGSRQTPVRGALVAALAAPAALAALVARTLAPAGFGAAVEGLRRRCDADPATAIDFCAAPDSPPATPEAPRPGFTPAEQAERIGAFLRSMGLTGPFAPLVVIMGHGSNSRNNPHASAYDCGACAGRHSGPNARLFAAMANRPEVRARLQAAGIAVGDDTWFIGAEHNTCNDGITWYDREDIPPPLTEAFARLDRQLAAAAREHARERCRRLASAPLGISAEAALHHVRGRRHDLAEARPELGHATNACVLIGRRRFSRGAFFDRRAFLISYDPEADADGTILERLLLANGPVGAGISLEYYFSTVDNEHFGCGTKIVHNLVGLFGVMEGASSDLRTGLPRQMIEIHEAMRLLIVVEQRPDIVGAIYARQPPLQELIGKGWIVVAAKDPDSPALHLFIPATGWVPWRPRRAIATVDRSLDWFDGRREALPPVLLERPLREAAA